MGLKVIGQHSILHRIVMTSKLSLNLAKCREIDNEHRRLARKPLLESLDVEFQRALEDGDDAKRVEVVAKKQVLRDITKDPAQAQCNCLDELIQAWPSDELGPCPYTCHNDD